MKKLNNEKKGIKQASVRSLSLCFILIFKSISRIETTNFHASFITARCRRWWQFSRLCSFEKKRTKQSYRARIKSRVLYTELKKKIIQTHIHRDKKEIQAWDRRSLFKNGKRHLIIIVKVTKRSRMNERLNEKTHQKRWKPNEKKSLYHANVFTYFTK